MSSVRISPATLEFLAELGENNYREWFQENKSRHTQATDNLKQLLPELISGINEFDKQVGPLDPADCLFRIYRDVRFSPNKAPYKTNLGAFIAAGGRKSRFAGYYIHIEPNASFLSGGIYMAPNDTMRRIREEISDNEDEFLEIVESAGFRKNLVFDGTERLKRLPRGFMPGSGVDEYLKLKHFTPFHGLSNRQLLKPNILEHSLHVFRTMYPLIAFLNRAIE